MQTYLDSIPEKTEDVVTVAEDDARALRQTESRSRHTLFSNC